MNTWVANFNAFGEAWLAAMTRAAWQGGLALLVAFAISRFVPGLSARVKCWIWRLAYLKVLVAFLWSQPLELPLLAPAATAIGVQVSVVEPATEPIVPQPQAAVSPSASLNLQSCLLTLWLAGVVAGAIMIGRDLVRLRNLKRRCVNIEAPGLQECAAELSQRLRLSRPPRLLACDGVSTPFVFGWWRPRIVLPSRLLSTTDSAALRLMIAHEIAHVKRR